MNVLKILKSSLVFLMLFVSVNNLIAEHILENEDFFPSEQNMELESSDENCIDESLIDPDAFCISLFDPVCGCNGITYGNSCEAQTQDGVLNWTSGICPPSCIDSNLIDPDANCFLVYEPVCGCDGITYSNSCFAQITGGNTSWTTGPCTSDCLSTNYVNGNIADGFFESTLLTYSDGNFAAGKTIVFESETEVRLDNNFNCDAGANFIAEIDNCNSTDLSIGANSSYSGVSHNFTKSNAGVFEFYFDGINTSLCPSNGVAVEIFVNGNLIYNQAVEISADGINPSFLKTFNAPANANILINLGLTYSTIPANQYINCFWLGNAFFKISE